MPQPSPTYWRSVPRSVWALGFVSLLMDTSSEMIHVFLPVFLVTTLGASTAVVGVIEGIGEATSSITRVFSGALSDRMGRRKRLAVAGYGLAAVVKPVFAVAVTPFEVLGARFLDRVGKGIRGAPRDALIADVTPASARGAAFGLRQALDTVGAFTGPLLGMALLPLLGGDLRTLFLVATLPALLAVALLVVSVEEPRRVSTDGARPLPLRRRDLSALPVAFWGTVGIGAVFTLARFSEAFLVLRAREVGLSLTLIPAVMIAMNVSYAGISTPAGRLSDRIDRRLVLLGSLVSLVAADLVLALWGSVAGVLVGAGLWGLHMGQSQGLLAALVADSAPERLRGTAFGLFHLVAGVALLCASVLAGWLWQTFSSTATFLCGAALASVAAVALLVTIRRGGSS